ncbi:MAG: hypothetical protein WC761_05770 [Candidatus Paceibacterota bacterium]|jgi:hypothetical protein
MKFSKKNLIPILSLVALLTSAGLYAYLYFSFTNLKNEISDLHKKTAESKATYDELAKVKENLKTTLGTQDRLSSLFVDDDSIVDFIQVLEDVMDTANVTGAVENVTEELVPDLDKVGKKKLHLTLVVSGNWNSVLKFQGLLEKIPFKALIDSANMRYIERETAAGSEWEETVNITVLVTKSASEERLQELTDKNQNEEI